MNRFLILLFLSLSLKSFAQYDAFKFNADLTFGYVKYTYTDVENGEYFFSNMSWSDTVHSLSYSHEEYGYKGVNAVFHLGLHIPVFKREVISLGFRPKAGIGRLIQVSPRLSASSYGQDGGISNDPKKIGDMTLDAELSAYVRFNLEPKLGIDLHTIFYGGYRFLRSHDNYSTPVVGFEFGQKYWSIGFYSHLIRMNYYREYSDGSKEIAKKFHEFGMKVNLFLGVKKAK